LIQNFAEQDVVLTWMCVNSR